MTTIEQTITETRNPLEVLDEFNKMMTSLKEYLPAATYIVPKLTPWKLSH